ncbi:MAG: fimbrillin family protein [Alistipes sp.]|nr:fimbrillin family protein [Alistipes sp.]
MKKVLFALAAVVALAACSKEQTLVTPQPDAIGFGTPFIENSTRVDYSTPGALTAFNVYGTVTGTAGTVNIYEGVEVTKTKKENDDIGDAGSWWYAAGDAQYWIPGASYNFAAIVDATVATKDTYHMPLTLTTQADDAMYLKDMLYATATASVNAEGTPSANPVNFNFSHLLSKVKFTVTSNAMGGYYHTVTGIKVSNFETGTYTIADSTWAGVTAKDVVFAEIANVTSATGALSNAELLLVPNAATFNVTFTVDLYKNGTKLGTETKTIPVDTDLVKGNSYNFTIDCSVGNPIKFGVTNDPTWGATTDVTIQ